MIAKFLQLSWNTVEYSFIHTQFLVIAAYLISSGFMSVYHMAVDTIFICASEFYLDALWPAWNYIPMNDVF